MVEKVKREKLCIYLIIALFLLASCGQDDDINRGIAENTNFTPREVRLASSIMTQDLSPLLPGGEIMFIIQRDLLEKVDEFRLKELGEGGTWYRINVDQVSDNLFKGNLDYDSSATEPFSVYYRLCISVRNLVSCKYGNKFFIPD